MKLAYVGTSEQVSPWMLRAWGRSNAQFAAACCAELSQAEQIAALFHARWAYDDVDVMLRETRPDGVIVAQTLAEREATVKSCLSANVPVMTAGMPIQPSNRNRKGTAFVWSAAPIRFSPAGGMLRRLVESGDLGDVLSVRLTQSRCRTIRDGAESAWPVSRDLVFEALDLLDLLVGPIRQLFARGHPDGAVVATLLTEQDVPVSLCVYEHGCPENAGISLELRGVDGALLTLDPNMCVQCVSGTRSIASYLPTFGVSDPAVELGYVGWINEFLRRIANRARGGADVTWSDTVRCVEAVMAGISRSGAVTLDSSRKKSTAKA